MITPSPPPAVKLTAEDTIASLRAERDHISQSARGWYNQNSDLIRQRDEVWEENKRLRATITRLEGMLRPRMYKEVGADPLDPNPDGSDFHLMNAIDDVIAGRIPEPKREISRECQ